jgi:hypothetical protein
VRVVARLVADRPRDATLRDAVVADAGLAGGEAALGRTP